MGRRRINIFNLIYDDQRGRSVSSIFVKSITPVRLPPHLEYWRYYIYTNYMRSMYLVLLKWHCGGLKVQGES